MKPLTIDENFLTWFYRGDPEKMTLWGQSAGAISVHYYLYSYLDNPIVHAFIADSGGPSSTPENSTDYTHSNFTAIAGLVGCGGLDGAGEFECSESLSELFQSNSCSVPDIEAVLPGVEQCDNSFKD